MIKSCIYEKALLVFCVTLAVQGAFAAIGPFSVDFCNHAQMNPICRNDVITMDNDLSTTFLCFLSVLVDTVPVVGCTPNCIPTNWSLMVNELQMADNNSLQILFHGFRGAYNSPNFGIMGSSINLQVTGAATSVDTYIYTHNLAHFSALVCIWNISCGSEKELYIHCAKVDSQYTAQWDSSCVLLKLNTKGQLHCSTAGNRGLLCVAGKTNLFADCTANLQGASINMSKSDTETSASNANSTSCLHSQTFKYAQSTSVSTKPATSTFADNVYTFAPRNRMCCEYICSSKLLLGLSGVEPNGLGPIPSMGGTCNMCKFAACSCSGGITASDSTALQVGQTEGPSKETFITVILLPSMTILLVVSRTQTTISSFRNIDTSSTNVLDLYPDNRCTNSITFLVGSNSAVAKDFAPFKGVNTKTTTTVYINCACCPIRNTACTGKTTNWNAVDFYIRTRKGTISGLTTGSVTNLRSVSGVYDNKLSSSAGFCATEIQVGVAAPSGGMTVDAYNCGNVFSSQHMDTCITGAGTTAGGVIIQTGDLFRAYSRVFVIGSSYQGAVITNFFTNVVFNTKCTQSTYPATSELPMSAILKAKTKVNVKRILILTTQSHIFVVVKMSYVGIFFNLLSTCCSEILKSNTTVDIQIASKDKAKPFKSAVTGAAFKALMKEEGINAVNMTAERWSDNPDDCFDSCGCGSSNWDSGLSLGLGLGLGLGILFLLGICFLLFLMSKPQTTSVEQPARPGTKLHKCFLLCSRNTFIWIPLSIFLFVSLNQVSAQLRSAISVSGGPRKTCAVLDNGKIKCWGEGIGEAPNQMGDNLETINLNCIASKVSLGGRFACALCSSGQVKCWGYGEGLGQGVTIISVDQIAGFPSVNLGTGRRAVSISCGDSHVCTVLDNSQIKCWGSNYYGQLGLGDTSSRGEYLTEMGDNLPFVSLGTKRTALLVAAGAAHTCALLDDKQVKCWGENRYGDALGFGSYTTAWGDQPNEMGDYLLPVSLGSNQTAKSVAVGAFHTCVLLDSGLVKCWGYNTQGQLGLGLPRNTYLLTMGDDLPILSLGTSRTAISISAHGAVDTTGACWGCNSGHTCVLLNNAQIKCWGQNPYGQLGLGDTANKGLNAAEMGDNLTEVYLGSGRTAVEVFTLSTSTCAKLDNGLLKCWGKNTDGELGLGDKNNRGDNINEMGDFLPTALLGNCSPPCAAGYYESTACDSSSDRVCSQCSTQACSAEHYESTACSRTTNKACSLCQSCSAGYYETTACNSKTNRVCTPCQSCSSGYYETAACTSTSDRICVQCAVQCTSGFYETSPCSSTSNRVCAKCAPCAGSYFYLPVTNPSTNENCACAPCASSCSAGYYESTSCSGSVNRVCSPCASSCSAGYYESTSCSGSVNRVCSPCASSCSAGYYESTSCSGSVNRVCSSKQAQPITLIVASVAGVGCGLVLICVCVAVFKFRKQRERVLERASIPDPSAPVASVFERTSAHLPLPAVTC